MKRTLLVLSFFPAFYPPRSGGELRLYYLYRHLSKHFRVVLISSSHFSAEDVKIVHNDNFVEYRLGKTSYYYDTQQVVSSMAGFGDISAIAVALCAGFPQTFYDYYFREYSSSDIIIHDSPFMCSYDLLLGLDQKPRIYNSYNAEYHLYKSLHPSDKSDSLIRYVAYIESIILRSSWITFYCSDTDEKLLDALVPGFAWRRMFVPNGTHRKPRAVRHTRHKSAVFIGSGHLPNVEAAEFIIETLSETLSDFTFHIVGTCWARGCPKHNVICHGRIDESELDRILEYASIALNPMMSGAGSNLKVFDYMMGGLPTVSTAFGMRGTNAIAGQHFIESDLDGFGNAISCLYRESDRWERIRDSARKLVISEHSWESIADRVAVTLNVCIEACERAQKPKFYLALNDYDVISGYGGGASRITGLHTSLASLSKTILLCFHDGVCIEKEWYNEKYIVVKIPKASAHAVNEHELNKSFWISSSDIITYKHCQSNDIVASLFNILSTGCECVILEHPYMAGLILDFKGSVIYSSHNHETKLKTDLLTYHPHAQELLCLVSQAEKLAVEKSDLIVGVSKSDLSALMSYDRHKANKTLLIPNSVEGVHKEWRKINLQNFDDDMNNVVFLGSAHPPNVEGLHFIESLSLQMPDVIFNIIGSVGGSLKGVDIANIRIWGEVPPAEKSAILMRSKVALNPVTSGGGSNVKLSDYMAHGLRTVTVVEGIRGYDARTLDYCFVSELKDFSKAIRHALAHASTQSDRAMISAYFDNNLSMAVFSAVYAKTLSQIKNNRSNILFVTYRFTDPELGGAETYLLKLLRILDASDEYNIHVVCPAVGKIEDVSRFSCRYRSSEGYGWPTSLRNTTVQRFDATSPKAERSEDFWLAQMRFEELSVEAALLNEIVDFRSAAVLLYGWHSREVGADGSVARWTTGKAAILMGSETELRIVGWSPFVTELMIENGDIYDSFNVSGYFDIRLSCRSNLAIVHAEGRQLAGADKRVLSARITQVLVGSENLIESDTAFETIRSQPADIIASVYDTAARQSRWTESLSLSENRGPHSDTMDRWLTAHVKDYDLLITHNSVFRPATYALKVAKRHSVPSIFIPHFHLEDDFYFFKDAADAISDASVTLVTPRAACDFLGKSNGADIRHHGPGVDAAEFEHSRLIKGRNEFRKLRDTDRPYYIILGRKTSSKGYKQVIDVFQRTFAGTHRFDITMIGQDEDQQSIDVPGVTFLGPQSRDAVIGALSGAVALINMSVSESFGMVILEAWMAGTPVIVNGKCAAFQDLVTHGKNGFLVQNDRDLSQAMRLLSEDSDLRDRFAKAGKQTAQEFSWDQVGSEFLDLVSSTLRYTENQNVQ